MHSLKIKAIWAGFQKSRLIALFLCYNEHISIKEAVSMKKFNVTGLCVKEKHYMVDTTKKLKK